MMIPVLNSGVGTRKTQYRSNTQMRVLYTPILWSLLTELHTSFSQNDPPQLFGLPGRAHVVNDELSISQRNTQLR